MTTDYGEILRLLIEHDVNFAVVGAISAVLQDASITTFEIDIVHDRAEENITNLLRALDELDAVFRGHTDKEFSPERTHLQGEGHHLLVTRFGPLEVLGVNEDQLDYEELVGRSTTMSLEAGEVQILQVEEYLEFQRHSDRPKAESRIAELEALVRHREERS